MPMCCLVILLLDHDSYLVDDLSWWWACPGASVCRVTSSVLGQWVSAVVLGMLVVWPSEGGFANRVVACWSCPVPVLAVRKGMGCSTMLLSSDRLLGCWVGMGSRRCLAGVVEIVAKLLWAGAKHCLVPYCVVCLNVDCCHFVWTHLVIPWVSRVVWARLWSNHLPCIEWGIVVCIAKVGTVCCLLATYPRWLGRRLHVLGGVFLHLLVLVSSSNAWKIPPCVSMFGVSQSLMWIDGCRCAAMGL